MTDRQADRESERIENKQSLGEWKEVVESAAAFATSSGGMIRIGIKPNGDLAGVQLGHGSLEDLANKVKLNTDPPQYPSITYEGDEKSAVVTVTIQESPVKPVWAFHHPMKRVGRTNQRLTREETRRLTEITTGRTWDSLPCEGLGFTDMSQPAVQNYLKRSEQDTAADAETVLRNLGLVRSGSLVNSAALLFATRPQQFFPGAKVKCARFAGVTSVQFLDERTFDGNVLWQLEEAMAFVARNTRQAIAITGKSERETIPEYPEEAVREAITNAVCHRDYAATSTIQVRIYDDRLEIWNPGTLPPDLPIESLYHEHHSHPRNPILADALYRARAIEAWGTGTLRILRACETQGLPKPEFVTDRGMFIVRFVRSVAEPALPGDVELNDRQMQAVQYVHEHGSIRTNEYQRLTGVAERQALRDLASLVDTGVFTRVGAGRSVRYSLQERD